MPPVLVRPNGQDEYLYEFAFTPVEPVPPEYHEAYIEAQKKWLELWKPYPWHFVQ